MVENEKKSFLDRHLKMVTGLRIGLMSTGKVLSWAAFFCFEFIAMALIQSSVFMSGRARLIALVAGLLLSVGFIRLGLQAMHQKRQVIRPFANPIARVKAIKWPTWIEIGQIIGVYVIAMAVIIIWNTAQNVFFEKWASSTTENQAAIDQLMNAGGWYSNVVLSLVIVLLGPILEELLFRGLFFRYFKWEKAPYVTVLLSGLFFGLYHLGSYTWVSLLDLPPYLILGVALAYVYQKTDKLSSSMLLHIVHNGWVQAASLWMIVYH
ncbi:CPBP family intramembrane metalloprotease [Fructobacillus sp. M1-13]|uniref:CPBP family intramembrane metalloprotease n=1 Tax=Fructobacillus papyriferae TaxID=2713171 RepID=A0ABS5QQ57_9LACO|nr:CPBP family intramembrane glutamic endopeptidase [Fructobacillus papyriferae]MBS9335323.1 CPBP family intramembrane metalloprotease [Fructobacillus papyriferae]MCD2159008.1 CPBP family intramembrane metalloprotease [Fructobacillus papyriferae]